MVPDAEVLAILCQVLTKLSIKDFTVKVCSRRHPTLPPSRLSRPLTPPRFDVMRCRSTTARSSTASLPSAECLRTRFGPSRRPSTNSTRCVHCARSGRCDLNQGADSCVVGRFRCRGRMSAKRWLSTRVSMVMWLTRLASTSSSRVSHRQPRFDMPECVCGARR